MACLEEVGDRADTTAVLHPSPDSQDRDPDHQLVGFGDKTTPPRNLVEVGGIDRHGEAAGRIAFDEADGLFFDRDALIPRQLVKWLSAVRACRHAKERQVVALQHVPPGAIQLAAMHLGEGIAGDAKDAALAVTLIEVSFD